MSAVLKANAVVVNDAGKFLIINHKNDKKDEWNWPGGRVEEGEDLEKAILRELEEKLGVTNFKIIKKSSVIVEYDYVKKKTGESKRGFLFCKVFWE